MSKTITLVKEISGLTVLELAELTKALESAFGVSAAMPMAAAMPASSAPAEAGKKDEEKTEFKVELLVGVKSILKVKVLTILSLISDNN